MALLRGRLLVATPLIGAGPFWRSVVFVLDHGDDGALGVIVNRPLNAAVADVLPNWADAVTAPTQLFDGGPVGSDAALALGVVREGLVPHGWHQMADRVGLVDLGGPGSGLGPVRRASGVRRLRRAGASVNSRTRSRRGPGSSSMPSSPT